MTFFMLVVTPGCFCLLSLFVAVAAMATIEWEEASVAEAKEKEEEFSQILKVLKRGEEEEVRPPHHLYLPLSVNITSHPTQLNNHNE